jgi:hypothetical protein
MPSRYSSMLVSTCETHETPPIRLIFTDIYKLLADLWLL